METKRLFRRWRRGRATAGERRNQAEKMKVLTYTCTCVMCLNILSTIVSISFRSSFYPTATKSLKTKVFFSFLTSTISFLPLTNYSSLSSKSISGRYKFKTLFTMIKINKQFWIGITSDFENNKKAIRV